MNLGGNTGSCSRPKKGGRKVPFLCNNSEEGFCGGSVTGIGKARKRKRAEPDNAGPGAERNTENVKEIPQGPSGPQTMKEENTI